MKTEKNKKGFTLAELLTAVVIIAILIGILMPALNMARNYAKNAKQKVQISSIEVGINMYRNDFGEYPPSHGDNGSGAADYKYCGAQTLAEAMFGYDLMGFHPNSGFDAVKNLGTTVYKASDDDNLKARKGLYIDRTNLGVFDANDVFGSSVSAIQIDGYMICDIFDATGKFKMVSGGTKKLKIGTPILYYRANTASLDINPGTAKNDRIYDYEDNDGITITLGTVKDGTTHSDFTETTGPKNFLTYIEDPMASTSSRARPVRPDSFLLISAGQDGLYGTSDDICNFEPNF